MKTLKVLCMLTLFLSIGMNAQTKIKTIEQAKTLAMNENKKIVVEFSTDWCTFCKRFEKKTLADKTVKARLQEYVFVSINPEKFSDEFVKMNDEKAYPKFILLDKNGKILDENIGYLETKAFLEFLN